MCRQSSRQASKQHHRRRRRRRPIISTVTQNTFCHSLIHSLSLSLSLSLSHDSFLSFKFTLFVYLSLYLFSPSIFLLFLSLFPNSLFHYTLLMSLFIFFLSKSPFLSFASQSTFKSFTFSGLVFPFSLLLIFSLYLMLLSLCLYLSSHFLSSISDSLSPLHSLSFFLLRRRHRQMSFHSILFVRSSIFPSFYIVFFFIPTLLSLSLLHCCWSFYCCRSSNWHSYCCHHRVGINQL